MTSEPIDLDAIERRFERALHDIDPDRDIVRALVAEVRRLREQRDAARAEVMGELLDARRRAEQAEAAVARIRELCDGIDPRDDIFTTTTVAAICRALDGGEDQ